MRLKRFIRILSIVVLLLAALPFGSAPVNASAGLLDAPTPRPAWTVESDQNVSYFGESVSDAGDVNGDGYGDVIVGAYWYDNSEKNDGRAYLYLGSPAGLSATPAWIAEGDQYEAFFGVSVSAAGDVNGDGYGDVIVGAYGYDNGETNEGRAYLYLGSPAGLSATPAWTAESDQTSAFFGISVSEAGDVNGDGYGDVIVGAPDYDNPELNEGRAYLYLGSPAGLSAAPAWTAEGNQTYAELGWSVSTAGDVNGDGYDDAIVGAYHYDNGETNEGRAYLYLGSPAGLMATPAWTAEGDQDNASFGVSVSTAGDVNGDGYDDAIVGAYDYDDGETDEGRAYLYLGSPAGLRAAPAWTAEGDQADAHFGRSVSDAGDMNGDGYGDVIVGAYWYTNDKPYEGQAYLYLGSSRGLLPSPRVTYESNARSPYFAFSVSGAGDVNGDGLGDYIVGAYRYLHTGAAFAWYGR